VHAFLALPQSSSVLNEGTLYSGGCSMATGKRRRAKRDFLEQRFRSQNAAPGPHPFALVLDHLEPDFNPGKIYRSADAFGCRAIHLVGMTFFDPGPAKGSFKHVPSYFHEQFDEAYRVLLEGGYRIYALMPDAGPSLFDTEMPLQTAFILGNEADGLSFRPQDYPQVQPLRIPQFGNPQSLNVSVAASIAMYEWLRRHGRDPGPLEKRDRAVG
jgi:tRNA G18 (ribose-2'-O)-methylase SpoU